MKYWPCDNRHHPPPPVRAPSPPGCFDLLFLKRIKLADGGKKGSVNTVGPTAAGKLVSLFAEEPRV